jgi:uncharacterized protein with NAD-binding domain and iron-sulfur cluster
MPEKVIIIGGGVGGLTAAHELIERGFEVHLYERRTFYGGKAASQRDNTGDPARPEDTGRPKEHGFRFYPGWYRHLPDTLSRIRYRGPRAYQEARTVLDNLVPVEREMLAWYERDPITLLTHVPRTLGQARTARAFVSEFAKLGLAPGELTFFVHRMATFLVTPDARRAELFESMTWWDYLEAESKSAAYQELILATTRLMVAAKAKEASAYTIGRLALRTFADALATIDRVMDGPTNEMWIDPWVAQLKGLGVKFHPGWELDRIEFAEPPPDKSRSPSLTNIVAVHLSRSVVQQLDRVKRQLEDIAKYLERAATKSPVDPQDRGELERAVKECKALANVVRADPWWIEHADPAAKPDQRILDARAILDEKTFESLLGTVAAAEKAAIASAKATADATAAAAVEAAVKATAEAEVEAAKAAAEKVAATSAKARAAVEAAVKATAEAEVEAAKAATASAKATADAIAAAAMDPAVKATAEAEVEAAKAAAASAKATADATSAAAVEAAVKATAEAEVEAAKVAGEKALEAARAAAKAALEEKQAADAQVPEGELKPDGSRKTAAEVEAEAAVAAAAAANEFRKAAGDLDSALDHVHASTDPELESTRKQKGRYFVFALPVEQMAYYVNRDAAMTLHDPSLRNIVLLSEYTDWMAGIQFYLKEPFDYVPGHIVCMDSQWSLTAIEHTQFWRDIDLKVTLKPGSNRTVNLRGVLSVDIAAWDTKGRFVSLEAFNCTTDEIATEVWNELKASVNRRDGVEWLRDDMLVEHKQGLQKDVNYHLDDNVADVYDRKKQAAYENARSVEFSSEALVKRQRAAGVASQAPYMWGAHREFNAEPLLINRVGSLALRPEAKTGIPNMFLAADYVRTETDLACMEGANEAARRAVNALLDAASSHHKRCQIWSLSVARDVLEQLTALGSGGAIRGVAERAAKAAGQMTDGVTGVASQIFENLRAMRNPNGRS